MFEELSVKAVLKDYLKSTYGAHAIRDDISLFSLVNQFQARDVAYLLLEIENRYQIPVRLLVDNLERTNSFYSVNDIAQAIHRIGTRLKVNE